jgi:hypothetical protein
MDVAVNGAQKSGPRAEAQLAAMCDGSVEKLTNGRLGDRTVDEMLWRPKTS